MGIRTVLRWTVMPLLAAVAACGAHRGAPAEPTEWIFIDGAKEPGLLPQWLVWENVFSGVHIIRDKHLEGSPLDSLAVTPAELKRIDDAGAWYGALRDACEARQRKAGDRQADVVLDCRQQVLDRADDLLRSLSAQGRAALLAYAEARKSGMWARIARSELEFFRQPR
jgi:hypothetical protein